MATEPILSRFGFTGKTMNQGKEEKGKKIILLCCLLDFLFL